MLTRLAKLFVAILIVLAFSYSASQVSGPAIVGAYIAEGLVWGALIIGVLK